MSKKLNLDYDDSIDPVDYKAKLEYIIDILEKEVFINANETSDKLENLANEENEKPQVRKAFKYSKYEIMPTLTPMQVNAKLNELLRVYKPMNLEQAKKVPDTQFLVALKWYMHLISHINVYLAFLPSKQTFCSFANITSSVYNDLLQDINYSAVFNSIEDYLVDANFTSSQAGIVDSKTTIAKLQTKDAGHNLIKSPESIVVNNYNTIDKQQVNLKLDRLMGSALLKNGNKGNK